MKCFENVKEKTFSFSSCELCDARCCDGRKGSVYSDIVISEFEKIKDHFPIVFVIGEMKFLKPVVLLTNGKDFCRYSINYRCFIYDSRPRVCKTYPLSPHLTNEIFIDTSCPAVGSSGDIIINNGDVTTRYKNDIFDNYQDKMVETYNYFNSELNKKENLQLIVKIKNIPFYRFKNDMNDKFLKKHIESLKYLDQYFIS